MVKPRPLAALIIMLSLLPSVAHAMSWIRIADVSKVHEVYNTTSTFQARWWNITSLPVDIDLPPTNALYVKITAKLQCSNGIPPKYNITFYVSFAGHNMTKRVVGYGGYGAEYEYVLAVAKNVSGKLHIDLATDVENCVVYIYFLGVTYNSELTETLDWNIDGNATITFEYEPPNPPPDALEILPLKMLGLKLDPNSTTTTITVVPRQLILVPVPEDLSNYNVVGRVHRILAQHIARRSEGNLSKQITAYTLVALSLMPKQEQRSTLYLPHDSNYTFVADARVKKLVEVKGAEYSIVNGTMLLWDLEATVKVKVIEEVPTDLMVWVDDNVEVIEGKIYLPAEAIVDVYYVEAVLEAELPNATTVEWRGENYTISFNASKIYSIVKVNDEEVKKVMIAAVEEITVCYYADHGSCVRLPIRYAYAPWGYLRVGEYNETSIQLNYFIPELYSEVIDNTTYNGVIKSERILLLVYGFMEPGTTLEGLSTNGTVDGTVVALSADYRLACTFWEPTDCQYFKYKPYETKHGYLLAFNADGYIMFSAAVSVHVRDAETGGPVEAEVLALQNGTVVDRARGSDVTLKLFPGNYTLEARIGSLAFYRNLTVKDDMDVTIKVTLPKVTNVTVKAPRYSFGETELRITVKLDKPAPADYNITGRIIVDDSWERNFTIPVKANTTEASTVVKLNLGEGKHHIKIIVGNAVAEAEVTVASGSIGFAVAAVVGITAVGVILFLLRRPREIAF